MPCKVFRKTLLLLLIACPLLSWAADPLWIDVRTAEEYAQGHVSAAVNIPYEEITDRVGEVTADKDALIYVYCRSGRRSGIAKGALEAAGYRNVVNVGGLQEAMEKAATMPAEQ
jgi:phage shock protein E